MFDRRGPLTLDGFAGSGAEFMPEFKKFIDDGKTIVCSPHNSGGHGCRSLCRVPPQASSGARLRSGRGARCGCRSKVPEGDGHLAALTNFRFIANGVWTTDETVKRLTTGLARLTR
jgi:hypothetical protein